MNTILLFDFDGVLNPIPYRREWIGPEDAGLPYSLSAIDPRNWQVVELDIDDALYFKPDAKAVVMLPTYRGEREVHIRWSTELMEKIRALVATGTAEFRWLTSWREHAPTLLAPLLGFNPAWVSIPWQQKMSDYDQVFKLGAIEDMVEEGERRPLVWMDDVAVRNVRRRYAEEGSPLHKRWGDEVLSPFKRHGIETLFLETSTEYGISREQWNQVEEFVRAQAQAS